MMILKEYFGCLTMTYVTIFQEYKFVTLMMIIIILI